jgi:3-methylfumaryl-CoA hydratase
VTSVDVDQLRMWLGRTETATETLAVSPAEKLAVTLNQTSRPSAGQPLPPLWHWLYFTTNAAQSELGVDGHPRRGGFLPPVSLPCRMWGGGQLTFHHPLRLGETVTRTSEILGISQKTGSRGTLVIVTVKHSLANASGLAIEEVQDIVYSETASTARPAAVTAPLSVADWRRPVRTDTTLLFRYSAITFNAHRIHYDLPYATRVEGYPGVVVQGPLMATLLLDCHLQETGHLPRTYRYRGQAPLFGDDHVALCGRRRRTGDVCELWAEGPGGYLAMTATVTGEAGVAD